MSERHFPSCPVQPLVSEVEQIRARDRGIAASRSQLLLRLLDEQEAQLRRMIEDVGRMQEAALLIFALSK